MMTLFITTGALRR